MHNKEKKVGYFLFFFKYHFDKLYEFVWVVQAPILDKKAGIFTHLTSNLFVFGITEAVDKQM